MATANCVLFGEPNQGRCVGFRRPERGWIIYVIYTWCLLLKLIISVHICTTAYTTWVSLRQQPLSGINLLSIRERKTATLTLLLRLKGNETLKVSVEQTVYDRSVCGYTIFSVIAVGDVE